MRQPEYIKDSKRFGDGSRRIVSKANGLWQAEYRATNQSGSKTESPWRPIGPETDRDAARNIMHTHNT